MKVLTLVVALAFMQGPVRNVRPLEANFGGVWTLVANVAVGSSPVGRLIEITQTGRSLTLKSDRDGAVSYALDGSESNWETKTVQSDIWRKSARLQIVTNAVVITTHTDAGPTGKWDDLMVLSLDRAGHLTLVSSSATIYPDPVMSTNLFVYDKKSER